MVLILDTKFKAIIIVILLEKVMNTPSNLEALKSCIID